ncbi:MAG: ribosomal protein S5, nonfunctional [Candidatus Uhrbacteria bacterium GW2011_GWA2_52_8d]|uniref:Small ribosomal subunit protein uS5 n=1 Tax=Candidatus Uhrbacteria bacterium GW2011_GWA2_52_8d TaxID=1618979 RepID=A0A0G2ALF8_9BACT|nr:MAG: ribosomal protein S5, nonfunctional [Candidatus Uhrbacteria bacterium GW2011_GWA2_52_8d]
MAMENNAQSTNLPARPPRGGGRGAGRGGQHDQRRPGRGRGKRDERAPREFEQKILDLARVTRVTAGGKRMSFRCALVIGDKKGRVGFGVAKGADVQIAIEKAYKQAKKHVLVVPLLNQTLPHPVWVKFGSALILVKPAPEGTGLKSGGAVRMILEFAGVPNAVSKIVNSSNKINIAKATLEALKQMRSIKTKASIVEGTATLEPQPVVDTI